MIYEQLSRELQKMYATLQWIWQDITACLPDRDKTIDLPEIDLDFKNGE